jgi:tetratricopeptide (TPR) repeat protein
MLRRLRPSQRGLSLIRFVLWLIILTFAVLYVLSKLPNLGGTSTQILNQLINQAKQIVSGLFAKLQNLLPWFKEQWAIGKTTLSRKIVEIKYWLCERHILTGCKPPTDEEAIWTSDMKALIDFAEKEGFDMSSASALWQKYQRQAKNSEMAGTRAIRPERSDCDAGLECQKTTRSISQVPRPTPTPSDTTTITPEDLQLETEKEFWEQMQTQMLAIIMKNIDHLRNRPLGCSDFTEELIKIKEIEKRFNEGTFEGYLTAKQLSAELENPRSLEFARDVFSWLRATNSKPFMDLLQKAMPGIPVYTLTENETFRILRNLQEDPTYVPPDLPRFLAPCLQDVLEKLEPLKDQEFVGIDAFLAGLEKVLCKEWARQYQSFIFDHVKKTERTPDYAGIIKQLDAMRRGPLEQILGDIVVGEIYLNYDLINPAENRFEAAINTLSAVLAQYSNTLTAKQLMGLHMALGLLHERVCLNADLAIKEFKDALACAQRIPGLPCQEYNIIHYHLGIINLRLREGNQVVAVTEKPRVQATPEPSLTPMPTPTPVPSSVKVTIDIPWTRSIQKPVPPDPSVLTSTSRAMGVTKGDITVPRLQRLQRPGPESGSQKVVEFKLENLYDLTKIPDDASREFQLYLQCAETGPQVDVARFIHDKYMENKY